MHSPLEISDRKRTLRENDAAVSLAPVSAEDEGKPCKD
jgi:hypothetical protein